MTKELVVLGCASQVPTRFRNHNGYFLRWDGEGILFDPGEGTQRQMLLAGVSANAITSLCITHFHGDHCFGLPGVLGRLSTDDVHHPVDIYYPAAGDPWFQRLRHAGVSDREPDVRAHPVTEGSINPTLRAAALTHRTETLGWRVEEPNGRRMVKERLDAAGIEGRDIGILQRQGEITMNGTTITLDEMSEPRRGRTMAFIMDTAPCDGARELADGVDLLVCESTYLESERTLAEKYLHMTAAQAATLARDSGAHKLVLTHYSSRYADQDVFLDEARPIFPATHVVRDLDVIPVSADGEGVGR